jgi:hypothetical protein
VFRETCFIASRSAPVNRRPLAVLRQMLEVLSWFAVVVLGLWALHRVALWAERRGWIYWTRRKASPGTAASALLELQSLLEPGNKHVVESRFEEHSEENESGEPPGEPANSPRDG